MSGTVTIKGARELERALLRLGSEASARRIGREALKAAAEPIRARAVSLAPDDAATGPGRFLRQSIKVAPGRKARLNRGQKGWDDAEDQVWMVIGIDQSVDPPVQKSRKRGSGSYRDPGVAGAAVMVEFGTPRHAAKPYMRPAWDAEKMATPGRVAAEIKPRIERAAKRAAQKSLKAR